MDSCAAIYILRINIVVGIINVMNDESLIWYCNGIIVYRSTSIAHHFLVDFWVSKPNMREICKFTETQMLPRITRKPDKNQKLRSS